MIFKTIDDSVDKTRKTLALFNKDWNTYKTNWQKGFSQNGIIGGLKSIFQSNKTSVISKEQIQILRNWNNAVKHGCTNQETFNRIIANADDNTKMYFAGLNKGKGSVEGLAKANNTCNNSFKIGSVILKAFGIALNMIAFAAIAKGISMIATKISEMSNATENAIQAGESFANSLKQTFSNVSENTSILSELNEEYQRLSKGVDALGRNVSLTTPEYNRFYTQTATSNMRLLFVCKNLYILYN